MERLKKFFEYLKENCLWLSLAGIACLTLGLLLVQWLTPPRYAPPPRYFQVAGIEYGISSHDEGKRFLLKKIEVAGYITSTVDWPGDVVQDDQTNFGSVGAPYAVVDGKMMIKLYGKWYTGIPRNDQ